MKIPTLRISVVDNFTSQMYNNYSKNYLNHYFDVDFDLKMDNSACSPNNISYFQKKYPEVVLTRREKLDSIRDFTITEKCIWYSQYDCWNYVSKQKQNCIILEHDVIPITGKDILWEEILEYDYYTFCVAHLNAQSKRYLISEIAGYVLSPSFARFALEFTTSSWKDKGCCSTLNTDGSWNEIVRMGRKQNFKIMCREQGYVPGEVLSLTELKSNQSVYQFNSPILGTTIVHS